MKMIICMQVYAFNKQITNICYKINLLLKLNSMHSSFKSKPIPYSKIKNQQINQNASEDFTIPDEHQKDEKNNITKSNSNLIFQPKQEKHNELKVVKQPEKTNNKIACNEQNRSLIRTYTFGSNQNSMVKFQSNKKLTHGLTNYKDIKSKFSTKDQNNSNCKSKSGSKTKLQCKVDQQFTKSDKSISQCTFTPKTNSSKQPYRNFKDFVNSQQNFLVKKDIKINKMKQQKSKKQKEAISPVPRIDKKSKRISQSNETYRIDSEGSLKKVSKKTPVHERLYNIPRKKDLISQQAAFTPKILSKSKSLVRNDRIQNLLYEDAQRRRGQQQLLKSQQIKSQLLISAQSKSRPSFQQNKVNNKLICNKIRTQFIQLLQNQKQICQGQQQQNKKIIGQDTMISPILAVTILSQLFNVQLNPNKNEQLCWKIIRYLITEDDSSENRDNCSNQYVKSRKLWEFIKAIVAGRDGFQKEPVTFSEEEVCSIHTQLGYFYSLRLSREPNRFAQPESEQYRIETSKTTDRLAEVHRNKKLQQISQFISQTNIQFINTMFNKKNKMNLTQDQEKIIRLQDLFILDSIRKKSQLEQKGLSKQKQEIKKYSFRPSLNPKSIQKAKQRKSRSKDRLKTIDQCILQTVRQNYNGQQKQNLKKNQQRKYIVKLNKQRVIHDNSKNNLNTNNYQSQNKSNNICQSIKNVDKLLLRQNIARKMREVEISQKQRGYNSSKNWLKQVQTKRKQICEQVSNFQGYKQYSKQKSPNRCNKTIQNYQSCTIK